MSMTEPTTLVTLGAVLLVVVVLTVLHKNISTVIAALVISLVLIHFVQQFTGIQLVNFEALGGYATEKVLQLASWIQFVFWPKLSKVATDLGNLL